MENPDFQMRTRQRPKTLVNHNLSKDTITETKKECNVTTVPCNNYNLHIDNGSVNQKAIFLFTSDEKDYIPPPVAFQPAEVSRDVSHSHHSSKDCDKRDVYPLQNNFHVNPVLSVPRMTDSGLELVKKALNTMYEKYMLTDEEINYRKMFVQHLQEKVRQIYPDAVLSLYGSSATGFGFINSDIHISISFILKKDIDTDSVLGNVNFLFQKDRDFEHVLPLYSAKIPVIKFRYHHIEWRGDISVCNDLALHNSYLLYTYSLIDKRCKVLGCALKLLAKKAQIAEATEQALSSYAYLNMVIYFLQQVEPPVLPVLQDIKLRKNNRHRDHIVQNCNVWFCQDLDYVKSVFKSENKSPVEKLWLDLLDYYCSFDYNKFISIRQKEPLFVDGEYLPASLFNIQDPFLVMKNLGRVVSIKKAEEIKSVLYRSKVLFGTPVEELLESADDIENFFFSSRKLTGNISKKTLCDLWGKSGHEKEECKQSRLPHRRNVFYQLEDQIAFFRRISEANTCEENTSQKSVGSYKRHW